MNITTYTSIPKAVSLVEESINQFKENMLLQSTLIKEALHSQKGCGDPPLGCKHSQDILVGQPARCGDICGGNDLSRNDSRTRILQDYIIKKETYGVIQISI